VPNIIVELRAEMTRVRQILGRLDPQQRVYASNCVRFAEENICLNSLEGMQESLSDLRAIRIQPQDAA
jgi:hypothetical protein